MAILADDVAFVGDGTATVNITNTFGNVITAVYTTPTQPGTVELFHVDGNGNAHSLGTAVAVSANAEDIQVVAFPMNNLRITYTNNNTTAGTVLIEAYARSVMK